jgi:hypothetical protein
MKLYEGNRVRVIEGNSKYNNKNGIVIRWVQGNKNGDLYEVRIGDEYLIFRDTELQIFCAFTFEDLCSFLPTEFYWGDAFYLQDMEEVVHNVIQRLQAEGKLR